MTTTRDDHARSRRISRRTFLVGSMAGAAGAGALVLAGCGDGKSAPTATPSPRPAPSSPSPVAANTAPARAAWSRVDATGAPSPRRDHSLTFNSDDGLIYVFGGRVGDTSNNELWTLDPKTSGWRHFAIAGAAPEPRFGHDALYDAANKRLVVALGQGNGRSFFNDVWAFDATGWKQLAAASAGAPEIRYGAGSAHDGSGNRLVISHGFTDQGRYDDTWTFDLVGESWSKFQTSGDVPIKRCLTRCAWLPASQSMLLFGGQTDSNPFLGDLWQLDVTKGRWQQQSPSPLPGARNLYGAALDAAGKHWYITTGNTPDGPVAETWSYDLASGAWSMLDASNLPPARYSADAAIAGGKLYIFGGHDGKAEVGDTWALPLPG